MLLRLLEWVLVTGTLLIWTWLSEIHWKHRFPELTRPIMPGDYNFSAAELVCIPIAFFGYLDATQFNPILMIISFAIAMGLQARIRSRAKYD